MHNNIEKSLKLQILACVDNIYTCALKANYIAYGNISCLKVIIHLNSNYYRINPTSLKENSNYITSAYVVNQPFETVIDQIKTATDFTDAGRVPFTPKQVATTDYNLIVLTRYLTYSF